MREIKFRGQRVDIKEWVYGSLVRQLEDEPSHYIQPLRYAGVQYGVIPETVGQFTGLKDKNGVEIYEGDIISFIEVDEDSCMGHEDTYFGKIIWIDKCAQFRCELSNKSRRELYLIVGFGPVYDINILGNIHEATPEQLKEWGLE